MKKKIYLPLLIMTIAVYMANMLSLFFISNSFNGHIIPWTIGLVVSIIGIFLVGPQLDTTWREKDYKLFLALLLVWWLNVLTALFTVLDIMGIGNHAITAVCYIVVPAATVLASVKYK